MERPRLVASLCAGALWLAGCGSAATSNPGTGSATLLVDANVSAENRVVNAANATDFDTRFSVRLSKGGAALHGATVQIESDLGAVVLVENNQTSGRYEGGQTGYAGTYALSAILGADRVEGAALTGPPVHSFSAPLLGAQAIYGQPLEVKWSPGGADAASLDTRELDSIAVPDTGAYTVPPGGLKKADPGKTAEESVRVVRSSTLALAGGVPGSSLSVSVRNEVTFLVVGQ